MGVNLYLGVKKQPSTHFHIKKLQFPFIFTHVENDKRYGPKAILIRERFQKEDSIWIISFLFGTTYCTRKCHFLEKKDVI
jgi:hypothetical protein